MRLASIGWSDIGVAPNTHGVAIRTYPNNRLSSVWSSATALIQKELRMEGCTLVQKLARDSVGISGKGRLGVDLYARFDGSDEWRLGQILRRL